MMIFWIVQKEGLLATGIQNIIVFQCYLYTCTSTQSHSFVLWYLCTYGPPLTPSIGQQVLISLQPQRHSSAQLQAEYSTTIYIAVVKMQCTIAYKLLASASQKLLALLKDHCS